MTQATINITGTGPVEIDTDLKQVILVGALAIDGSFVNCRIKKVRRNQKAAKAADKVRGAWLTEIKSGYFMLVTDADDTDE